MKKGWLIIILLMIFNMILITLENSTQLFGQSFESLSFDHLSLYLVDIMGILSLPIAYITLRLFYKKRARYIKIYPIVMLIVALMWTLAVQVK